MSCVAILVSYNVSFQRGLNNFANISFSDGSSMPVMCISEIRKHVCKAILGL